MANIMDQKTKYLLGRWSKRINMVEKAKGESLTYEKKAALANALENTHQRIRAMEAVNPNSIGQYKRYALDIVTAVVPNLIAFDCYAVQSMDNRIGMINYLDYSYSKEKGATKAGKVFASSINMGKSDPDYTSDLVKDAEVDITDSSGTFSGRFAWTPVIPNSVEVEVTGDQKYHYTVATSDATKHWIGDDGTAYVGELNEATGEFTIAPKVPGSGQTQIGATYRFNNEDVRSDGFDWDGTGAIPGQAGFTNVPEIELKINSVPIEAKARTLRSFWSFDAAYELQKELTKKVA